VDQRTLDPLLAGNTVNQVFEIGGRCGIGLGRRGGGFDSGIADYRANEPPAPDVSLYYRCHVPRLRGSRRCRECRRNQHQYKTTAQWIVSYSH
jgi:hypothetical protein